MKKVTLSIALLFIGLGVFAQTPEEILIKYQMALGKAEVLDKIKDYTVYLKGAVEGNELEVISIRKDPHKLSQIVSIAGMGEVSKTICDGQRVNIGSSMMGNQDLQGDLLKSTVMQAGLFPEKLYSAGGVAMKYIGKENIEGKENHNLELKIGEVFWNEFYDVQTGLKSRQIVDIPQGKVTITYSDYQEKEGMMIPMKLKQEVGEFIIELQVTDLDVNSGVTDAAFVIK